MEWQRARAAALILVTVSVACTDHSTDPDDYRARPHPAEQPRLGPDLERALEFVRGTPRVQIGPLAHDIGARSDQDLMTAIDRMSGRVEIGFKEPSSTRASVSGFRESVSVATIRAGIRMLVRDYGAEILSVRRHLGSVAARINPDHVATLRRHPLIEFVEDPVLPRLSGHAVSSTRSFAQGCTPSASTECTTWGLDIINARTAHLSLGATGLGAKVLMIDTGHEQGHEDLPNVSGANCRGAPLSSLTGCNDVTFGGSRYHGTYVLGIIVARDNDRGIVGVAPGVAGYNTRVFSACNASGCDTSLQVDGLDWAIEVGAHVVNMSIESDTPREGLLNATQLARAYNVLIVASAGNRFEQDPPYVSYPAGYPGVLGVSGIDWQGNFMDEPPNGLCKVSNEGTHVDVAGPFYGWSTVGNHGYEGLSPQYPYWCGNSFSAPHVAGIAALIRGRYPALGESTVHDIIIQTAVGSGWNPQTGYGIPDAVAALNKADSIAASGGGGGGGPGPPPPLRAPSRAGEASSGPTKSTSPVRWR